MAEKDAKTLPRREFLKAAGVTGAAAGAVVGGARRADQNRQQAQAQAQWEQQQVSQYEAARNSYNRAFAACMEGRGYTVR